MSSTTDHSGALTHVIAVRHADYDIVGNLTLLGRSQAESLAVKLIDFLGPNVTVSPIIVSSTHLRAQETARIISDAFRTSFHINADFCTDEYIYGHRLKRAVMHHANGSTIIIVVTHFEAPAGIISAFTTELFNRPFPRQIPEKDSGFALNLTTGEVSNII